MDKQTMTPEQKLLTAQALLPVLADFLEDYPMRFTAKHEQTKLINAVRGFDKFFMDSAGEEEREQQIDSQRWFRALVSEEFSKFTEL
jgi:hypothetical protein